MGDDEQQHINIEKTDDEEEINARNEVTLEVNDGNSEHNRNRRVVLKSKDKDVDELLPKAIEALKENYYGSKGKDKNDKGMFS